MTFATGCYHKIMLGVSRSVATFILSAICYQPVLYQSDGRTDPVAVIRAMVDRGEFADAAEALTGLPETIRHREAAFLYFKTYDLARTREAGAKHLAVDRNDVELLRILGDVAAMDRRFDDSEKLYREAKEKLETDPRLSDAARESEAAAIEYRFRYIEDERANLASVKRAEDRVGIAVYLAVGALAFVFVASLFVALAFGRPKKT
ncbi:MAG: hypothetical protein ACKVS6_17120 [Planctomycetota bacterium]